MIPLLVIGAFGEVNKDFEKVLKSLARMAAAGEDGMSWIGKEEHMLLCCNSLDEHYELYRGERDMANHKLTRVVPYYVRATAE